MSILACRYIPFEELSVVGEQIVQDAGEIAACRFKLFGAASCLGALRSGAERTEVVEPGPPGGQRCHDRCQVALARQVAVQPSPPVSKGIRGFQETVILIEGGQDPALMVFLPVALLESADHLVAVRLVRPARIRPHPGHGLQTDIRPVPEHLAEHQRLVLPLLE
jgi:hypothetical protein